MIATVRIAPVGQWCDAAKDMVKVRPEGTRIVGMPVVILTETAQESVEYGSKCVGKEWQMEQQCADKLAVLAGQSQHVGKRGWVCEHMLEMD
jgi:hypothetical protein